MRNQNPGLRPRTFDLDDSARNVALDEAFLPVAETIRELAEMVEDTQTAVRSNAYAAALTVYRSLKQSGKGQGLDGALDDLDRRFLRKSGGAAPAAPTAAK